MNCPECLALLDRDPRKLTTAERTAVCRHVASCDSCNLSLERSFQQTVASLPARLLPAATVLAALDAAAMLAKDRADPEA